jgi:DNA-binding XRE family transcriptional regulator
LVQALAQARQEAATLRGVLEAISDALAAATMRLDALEAHIPVDGAAHDGAHAALDNCAPPLGTAHVTPPIAPGRGAPRTSGWKLPNWTPASDDVVSGETLRLRREALGISQAAVAHAAHCSRGLVAEVERGKRRSAQTLAHLASTLDKLEQQARRN